MRCHLKDFLSGSLDCPFVQLSVTFCVILVKGFMRKNSVKLFEFGPVVQEEMSLKDISYLELWRPFCSAELKHICAILVEGINKNKSEIILNLDQWFRR